MKDTTVFPQCPSIVRISIWNLTSCLDGMCKQLKSGLLFVFYDKLRPLCIFSNRYIGHISRKKEKKKKLKRPAFSLFVGAWSTSCPKITPKYVKLSGAWPIHLSVSDWAGPARKEKIYSIEQQLVLDRWRETNKCIIMQTLSFVFFPVIEQQLVLDGWRTTKECIIMQMLYFVFFLVIGCMD